MTQYTVTLYPHPTMKSQVSVYVWHYRTGHPMPSLIFATNVKEQDQEHGSLYEGLAEIQWWLGEYFSGQLRLPMTD